MSRRAVWQDKSRYAIGETPLSFVLRFSADLSIEARPERLTGDAGTVLVREVIERTGILEWMTARLHDPWQPHLVTYPLAELGVCQRSCPVPIG